MSNSNILTTHIDSPTPAFSNEITPEGKSTICFELQSLDDVLASLIKQMEKTEQRLSVSSRNARTLTAALVGTHRDEDKHQLSSDESVEHGLAKMQRNELDRLQRVTKRPYFAHFTIAEIRNGKPVSLTYKIGFETNLDCRIIDWRDAPLARIFYHNEVGAEYFEEIQQIERCGVIHNKTRLTIVNKHLRAISTHTIEEPETDYHLDTDNVWKSGTPPYDTSFFHLPDVLSLITAEQFNLITNKANSAVLIQGIAGSGKTTVGLYRLAWLIRNQMTSASSSAIIVRNPALKDYIKRALPCIQLDSIVVYSTQEWITFYLTGSTTRSEIKREKVPEGIARLKSDINFAKFLTNLVLKDLPNSKICNYSFEELVKWYNMVLIEALRNYTYLNKEIIRDYLGYFEINRDKNLVDLPDLPLMLYVLQALGFIGYLPNRDRDKFTHLVVDEVQDLNQLLLATIIGSVDKTSQLTLLGDENQDLTAGETTNKGKSTFTGWENLLKLLNLPSEETQYVTLEISFRCTAPIMQLAESCSLGHPVTSIRNGKKGRKPIWFHAHKAETVFVHARDWLDKAVEKYPLTLTAVLCKSIMEARAVYHLLEPFFKNTIQLGNREGINAPMGLLVTSITFSKGLEFVNVMLWNVSKSNFKTDQKHDRNLLYVGCTRARENLALTSWHTSNEIISRCYHHKLVRLIDCDTVTEHD